MRKHLLPERICVATCTVSASSWFSTKHGSLQNCLRIAEARSQGQPLFSSRDRTKLVPQARYFLEKCRLSGTLSSVPSLSARRLRVIAAVIYIFPGEQESVCPQVVTCTWQLETVAMLDLPSGYKMDLHCFSCRRTFFERWFWSEPYLNSTSPAHLFVQVQTFLSARTHNRYVHFQTSSNNWILFLQRKEQFSKNKVRFLRSVSCTSTPNNWRYFFYYLTK